MQTLNRKARAELVLNPGPSCCEARTLTSRVLCRQEIEKKIASTVVCSKPL